VFGVVARQGQELSRLGQGGQKSRRLQRKALHRVGQFRQGLEAGWASPEDFHDAVRGVRTRPGGWNVHQVATCQKPA